MQPPEVDGTARAAAGGNDGRESDPGWHGADGTSEADSRVTSDSGPISIPFSDLFRETARIFVMKWYSVVSQRWCCFVPPVESEKIILLYDNKFHIFRNYANIRGI